MTKEYKYNIVSKETKKNAISGEEIPCQSFIGPYYIAGTDEEAFYMVLCNEGYLSLSDVEGSNSKDTAPKVRRFEKAKWKLTEY